MPTLVVPFRGEGSKSRIDLPAPATRAALARAMAADVVQACARVGTTFVVSPDSRTIPGAVLVADPRRGLGAAVQAGLDAALVGGAIGPTLVVNADVPCVTPRDLLTLAGAVPPDGLALVGAADGTTNALALASAQLFTPVYGPGSASRFAALAPSRLVHLPNLIDDVDTVADLQRLASRLGPRTRRVLTFLQGKVAA